ncbi:MAG: hypothetical protein ACRDH7_05495 [Actinomycetota bacterium]
MSSGNGSRRERFDIRFAEMLQPHLASGEHLVERATLYTGSGPRATFWLPILFAMVVGRMVRVLYHLPDSYWLVGSIIAAMVLVATSTILRRERTLVLTDRRVLLCRWSAMHRRLIGVERAFLRGHVELRPLATSYPAILIWSPEGDVRARIPKGSSEERIRGIAALLSRSDLEGAHP